MFQAIRDLILHRHYWRNITFGELSELYVSIMIRTMSLSLIGIFIPVYLYQLGYSVADIAIYFGFLYGVRIYLDPVVANLILKYGPKGVMRSSYLTLITSLGLLLLMKDYPIPYLVVSLSHAFAIGTFYLAFNFEFSKIKDKRHEGRDLGRVYTFQKIGGIMGPLAGGLIATFFGVEYTILVSIALLIAAAVPLMLTPETIETNRYYRFKFNDLFRFKRDFWPAFGIGTEGSGAVLIWPLFISIVVFKDNVYASLGFVTTLSLFVAVLSAYFFGRVIDDNRGGVLLRWSAITTGLSMFIRPFITSLGGVLAISAAVEPLASGILMPFNKGEFDASDAAGKRRLSYLTCILVYAHVGSLAIWLIVWAFAVSLDGVTALRIAFIASGLGTFLITTQKFRALRS